MNFKRLFIWVEGPDDDRFFRKIIMPRFLIKYPMIEIIAYSGFKDEKTKNFLRSIRSMKGDYIFIKDKNKAPCVTAKKEELKDRLKYVDDTNIIIVIKEIEGWYLAGLSKVGEQKLRIQAPNNTDNLTKEEFNNLIPRKFESRIDFKLELLEHFSLEDAKQKNKSFKYFIEKYGIEEKGNLANNS